MPIAFAYNPLAEVGNYIAAANPIIVMGSAWVFGTFPLFALLALNQLSDSGAIAESCIFLSLERHFQCWIVQHAPEGVVKQRDILVEAASLLFDASAQGGATSIHPRSAPFR